MKIKLFVFASIFSVVSMHAREVIFDNGSNVTLYVWPVPENKPAAMLAKLPPRSMGVRMSVNDEITHLGIFDDAAQKYAKEQRIPAGVDNVIKFLKGWNFSAKTNVPMAPQLRNAYVVDPKKRWAAFSPALKGRAAPISMTTKYVALAEKIK